MQFISKNGTESSAYLPHQTLNSIEWKNWVHSDVLEIFCKTIYTAFTDYNINPVYVTDGIKFGKNKMSSAFSLDHKFPFESIQELEYFQLYICEKLKERGYIVQLSEDKGHDQGERSLIIYQKPSYKLPLIQGKSDQIFGNIHVELRFHGEKLIFFKIIVHRYNDHKFDVGLEFDELLEFLFKV